MNDQIFCTDFRFNEYRYNETAHRDNSRGVAYHFLAFMKRGRARIETKEMTLEINENDMFYIPKGCQYHSYWIADGEARFDSIGFLYFPTSAVNGYCLQKIDYDKSILDAFLPLSRDKTVNASSIGALYRLLGLLEPMLTPASIDKKIAVYENLLRLIEKNAQMSIPEYANLCGISESLLYRYVKEVANKTPNRLRQEVLCQKAAELLFTTNYTIEEICSRTGFSSAAYFRTVFESVYHKSPSSMRKEITVI